VCHQLTLAARLDSTAADGPINVEDRTPRHPRCGARRAHVGSLRAAEAAPITSIRHVRRPEMSPSGGLPGCLAA